MLITLTPYKRCLKNFTPLKIITKREGSQDYFLINKSDIPIGRFSMDDTGYVCNLSIVGEAHRKKIVADAILTMVDFIIKKAKEKHLSVIFFASDKKPLFLKKMYEKLGAKCFSETDDHFYYFANTEPLKNSVEQQKIIAKLKEKHGYIVSSSIPLIDAPSRQHLLIEAN